MAPTTLPLLEEWCSALPALALGEELILRPSGQSCTATLRGEGVAPRVFVIHAGVRSALDPAADAGLPGAALIHAADRCQRWVGEVTGPLVGASLVAWRPGRRAVVRLRSEDGRVHWLKLLDQKTYRRAVIAFAAVRNVPSGLRLITPTVLIPAVCGYLAPSADGTPLHHLLDPSQPLLLNEVAQAVSSLAAVETEPGLPESDFQHARDAACGMLAKAASVSVAGATLEAALQRVPAPDHGPRGFVHGDLHDKQLFLYGTTASLIDLEGMAVGDTRFDAINLVEHLRLRDLQCHGRDLGGADSLLARLGLSHDASDVVAYQAVVRARLSAVYRLRPRWLALADRLYEEALALAQQFS